MMIHNLLHSFHYGPTEEGCDGGNQGDAFTYVLKKWMTLGVLRSTNKGTLNLWREFWS